jgi:hypothetical protein
MKRFIYTVFTVLMISGLAMADNGAKYPENHWKVFTKNVVVGLKSDNHAVRQAAMVLVIRYKDKLNTNKTIFPLVNIYEKNSDEKMRELAATTLLYTGNEWGENYLRENFEWEKNPQIKHLIMSYLQAKKDMDRYALLKDRMELLLATNNQ